MSVDRLRVFVSSKMAELAPERREIRSALDELKIDAWVFEKDAGARAKSIQQTYLSEVEGADLYIGLFWKGYGDYTIEEFEHACEQDKDCLVYEKRTELDGRDAKLQSFLDRLGRVETGLTIQWFNSPEELGEFIKRDVARWQAEIVRRHARSSDVTAGTKRTIERLAPRQLADIIKAPYKFLSYYDIGDRDIFFGRDAVIEELAGEIPRHNVLIINGQSGSGKTSLINAGLIPRLADNGYLYVYFRDYINPLEQLREYFRDHPDFALPDADKLSLLQILRTIRSQQESPVVVIFDQFERFLINVAAEPRREFLQQLRECLESDLTADELNLVISLRDDFYGKLLLEAEAIIPTFGTDSHHHNLRTLNREEARQAIIQPLKNIPNIGFDGKFVDEVLLPHLMGQATGEAKIEPPHLQIVCNQLYEAARDRYLQQLEDGEPVRIGFDLYHDLGETEGMLRDYLDDVVRRITNGDSEQIAIVRSMLKLMIETVGTRKFESVNDISSNLPDVPRTETETILRKLQESRVLETKHSESNTSFSLSHEFMVAKVQSWYDEREMERRRAQETVERGLSRWIATRALLDETEVSLIRDALPSSRLTAEATQLLADSERRLWRQKWGKRSLFVAVACVALLMPVAASLAIIAWRTNDKLESSNEELSTKKTELESANTTLNTTKKELEHSNQTLTETNDELERSLVDSYFNCLSLANTAAEQDNYRAALLWYSRAYSTAPPSRQDLRNLACGSIGDWAHKVAWRLPHSDDVGSVRSITFSPDGRLAALAAGRSNYAHERGQLVLFDTRTGNLVGRPLDHEGPVNCLVFTPDSKKVITGTGKYVREEQGFNEYAGQIQIWDIASGARINDAPMKHKASVDSLALSIDGALLASGGGRNEPDGTKSGEAYLWDMESGEQLHALGGHTAPVKIVAIDKENARTLTASDDLVRIWSAFTGKQINMPIEPAGAINDVVFSANENVVLTYADESYDSDIAVRRWDAKTGEELAPISKSKDTTTSAISPDGRFVVFQPDRDSVQIWDANTGSTLGDPISTAGELTIRLKFSSDSRKLLRSGTTFEVWDVTSRQAVHPKFRVDGSLLNCSVSSTGNHIAIWNSFSEEAELIEIRQFQRTLPSTFETGGEVHDLVVEEDGTRFVSMDLRTHTCQLHEIGKRTFEASETWNEKKATFLPHRRDAHLLLIGEGNDFQLWNLKTGQSVGKLLQHPGSAPTHTYMSHNGTSVLTVAADAKQAWLWRTDEGRLVRQWESDDAHGRVPFSDAALSSDGELVALANGDSVQLLDANTGNPLPSPPPFRSPATYFDVDFDLSGQKLAIAADREILVFDIASQNVMRKDTVSRVGGIRFDQSGKWLVVRDHLFQQLWSVSALAPITDWCKQITFSPTRPDHMAAVNGQIVDLWNLANSPPTATALRHQRTRNDSGSFTVQTVFSPDGDMLLTFDSDGQVRRFDAVTGEQTGSRWTHDAEVHQVLFCQDHGTVITLSGSTEDRRLRAWDVESGVARRMPFDNERVFRAFVAKSGRLLVTADNSGKCIAWPLSPRAANVAEQLKLSIEVRTGRYFDDEGALKTLPFADWMKRRQNLTTLGGFCDVRSWQELDR